MAKQRQIKSEIAYDFTITAFDLVHHSVPSTSDQVGLPVEN
jgi:hypothetical protein